MRKIFKRTATRNFRKSLYSTVSLFVTSDTFWDGGIQPDSPLAEKAAFYAMANKMASLLKSVFRTLDEPVYIGKPLCEGGCIYAPFSGMEQFETFRTVDELIGEKYCYSLSFPKDDLVVDSIVESNFRYFSFIAFYLPKSNSLFCPSCHTEILVYTKNVETLAPILEAAAKEHSDSRQIIRVKHS